MSSQLDLLRRDLAGFRAYSAAAPDKSVIRLHANEVSWRRDWDDSPAGLNRYPDPAPAVLSERLAALYGVAPESVLATRGSDDAIDVLVRAFCEAGRDSIVISSPTFGMYAVAARVQGARVIDVPLSGPPDAPFRLDTVAVARAVDTHAADSPVKLVFVCSPNNPTGNRQPEALVTDLLARISGRAIVVVDEAYVEFAGGAGLARRAASGELLVLRTLSRAYGMAGARVGALFGPPETTALLRALLPPYLLPSPCVAAALRATTQAALEDAAARAADIVARRARLARDLAAFPGVREIYPSDGNFLLVRFADAGDALARCGSAGILVRDFSGVPRLEGCLRITVGSAAENERLLEALAETAHV